MNETKRNVTALLERARKLCDPPTWYQLAKRTGIADTTISRCMRRGGTLGDINAYKLAEILGMDAKDVMAYMAEDRAQDERTKEFWRHQLPRLLPSFAIAVAASLSAQLGGSLNDGRGLVVLPPIHYAQLRRIAQLVLKFLNPEPLHALR